MSYFIAKGIHPFHTVNEPGFRKLLNVFEPRYKPPDRKTLANHYMSKMYEKERERVLDSLEVLTTTKSPQMFGYHVKADYMEQLLFITSIMLLIFKAIY